MRLETQYPCVELYMATNMPKERDDETGQYTPAASDAEILAYLSDTGGAGTTDVAGEFSYEQPTAYRRLRKLEDQGRVTSRKIGGSLLWEPASDDE